MGCSSLFRGPQGPPALAVERDRQSRRCAAELGQLLGNLPIAAHPGASRSSGWCPHPHPLAAGNSPCPQPPRCYSTGGTKERHKEAKSSAIARRGNTGILPPAPNRLVGPSSPWRRDGPQGETTAAQGTVWVHSPRRSGPQGVQLEGQHLKKQNGAFTTGPLQWIPRGDRL